MLDLGQFVLHKLQADMTQGFFGVSNFERAKICRILLSIILIIRCLIFVQPSACLKLNFLFCFGPFVPPGAYHAPTGGLMNDKLLGLVFVIYCYLMDNLLAGDMEPAVFHIMMQWGLVILRGFLNHFKRELIMDWGSIIGVDTDICVV